MVTPLVASCTAPAPGRAHGCSAAQRQRLWLASRAPPRGHPVLVLVAAANANGGMSMDKFQQLVSSSSIPMLVDFCTQWCGPCRIISKNMAVLEPVLRGRVQFEKIDTELHPAVADHFGIQKLPTLVLFKDGQPVDRVEGVMSAQDLHMHLMLLLK